MSKHPRYRQMRLAAWPIRKIYKMGMLRIKGGPMGLVWVPVNEVEQWKERYGDQLEMIEE